MKLNENMEELRALASRPSELQVAVYGKYNHGKSSLLNALVKKDIFKTADIRETIEIQSYTQKNITWIDTPGLDADVNEDDDNKANELLSTSDVLLFVHSVNEGELDNKEVEFLKEQYKNDKNIILILTQIDKIETLNTVETAIEKQLLFMIKSIELITVSAKRALHSNSKIREQSNIGTILNIIENNKEKLLFQREKEKSFLKEKINIKIENRLRKLNRKQNNISTERAQLTNEFLKDAKHVREKKHEEQ